MSNRISSICKGKALSHLSPASPSLEITEQLVYAMEEAGADLIELGIRFRPDSRRSCDPGSQCACTERRVT